MRRKPVVLITGASGEMGHGLIDRLAERGGLDILALDIRELEPALKAKCAHTLVGDILDQLLLGRLLSEFEIRAGIDFRSIRFPGLISAFTVPSGGTSDYAPEMIHAAAQNQEYACFVREDARIPFMAMPDGIDALLRLMDAAPEKLGRVVYNIG